MIYRVSLNSPNLFAVIIAITVVQLMAKEACQLRLGPTRRSSRLVETGGRGGVRLVNETCQRCEINNTNASMAVQNKRRNAAATPQLI